MEPLNTFLTKSNYVLVDLNKVENDPSKYEKIDAVIQNVINKINESDLTGVAQSSAEIAPIQKLLRSIGAHIRKSVDSETFKLFQVQVNKVRQNRKDFEEYERFDHELDDFLYEFRDGPSSDAAIKRAGKFINDNLRWFYSSANKMGTGAKVELAQGKLKQLSDLAGKTELHLTANFQKQIARILPRPSRIPQIPSAVWDREMLTFLPSENNMLPPLPSSDDGIAIGSSDRSIIESSYKLIMEQTQELPEKQRLKIVAGWINNEKIRLSLLPLPEKQIHKLAPFLTHLDLTDLDSKGFTKEKLEAIIQIAAPNIVSLTLLFLTVSLPESLPKLKNLIISERIIDLSKYTSLEKLSYEWCEDLNEISHPTLKIVKCSNCKNLNKIDCPQLKKLTVIKCGKLATISDLPNLEFIECYNCPIVSLSHLPNVKKMRIAGIEIIGALNVLREVPKLKVLDLHFVTESIVDCSLLKALKELEELSLYGAVVKGRLELPKLKKLTLNRCTGLLTKAFIKSFRFLESLNCSYCDFCALPDLPYLSTIKLNNCSKLLKLPEAPRLMEMTLENCPELSKIPYYPLLEEPTIKDCPNITTWPTNMLY